MNPRDQSVADRVTRAEQELVNFKNTQFFGRDVTKPKVIERYNSDGTPTEWDIIGTDRFGQWAASALITYTANTQKSPYASVYFKVRVNEENELYSTDSGGVSAYVDLDDLFNGSQTLKFDMYGSFSTNSGTADTRDPTIDRMWIKVYVLATDYGTVKIEAPYGFLKYGTLVPLV